MHFLNEKIKRMWWLTVCRDKRNCIFYLGFPAASHNSSRNSSFFFCGMYFLNLLDKIVNVDGFLTVMFPWWNTEVRLCPLDKHHLSLLTAARTRIFSLPPPQVDSATKHNVTFAFTGLMFFLPNDKPGVCMCRPRNDKPYLWMDGIRGVSQWFSA